MPPKGRPTPLEMAPGATAVHAAAQPPCLLLPCQPAAATKPHQYALRRPPGSTRARKRPKSLKTIQLSMPRGEGGEEKRAADAKEGPANKPPTLADSPPYGHTRSRPLSCPALSFSKDSSSQVGSMRRRQLRRFYLSPFTKDNRGLTSQRRLKPLFWAQIGHPLIERNAYSM